MWQIRVDVGGTFTDCVAFDANRRARFAKVLSSGRVRFAVDCVEGGRLVLRGASAWLPILSGAHALIDDVDAGLVEVVDAERGLVRIGVDVNSPISSIDLTTDEPAPILAARLVTQTPFGSALPPSDFRLATTRATNALLERRMARSALLVSEGFADVLRIGDQRRPDLYALNVVKPSPITDLVFGVPGRLGADGLTVVELDERRVRLALEEARRAGAEAVGIALINAWTDPRQEIRCEALCREAGFDIVARSSDVAPRIGLLSRAQAATIEASLYTILRTYLDRVSAPLPGSRVSVLGSSGGLTPSNWFRSVDMLLSGPAGGVVGAASAGRASGFDRLISFDMGGTSTDVARIDGRADLASAHTVGSVTIARPAVAVETVAAGGGSICHVVDGRPTVGPQSAGATPGPACYGAGGPLTITDVNLLLGRIDAEAFEIPIHADASRRCLEAFIAELQTTGEDLNEDELLAGLLDLANETMAEAIRAVSIRKGYDSADHVLVAFGGAGPQHACDIAERLGVPTVLIPREASLLSALGLHDARCETSAEREVLAPLRESHELVQRTLSELAETAQSALQEQFGDIEAVDLDCSARLRLVGQDSAITVDAADVASLASAFAAAYERMHGSAPDREIEVVGLRATAMLTQQGAGYAWSEGQPTPSQRELTQSRVHDGFEWVGAAVYTRGAISPNDVIDGPALIRETRTQTWIPRGWRCVVDDAGALRIEQTARREHTVRSHLMARELIAHRLASIAEQMGEALERAAVSVNVKERRDYSCGVLDAQGKLVSSAAHLPVHIGALGACVRRVIATLGPLDPGDAALTNHPAFGGSHLPDLTLVQPVFNRAGERVGYVASRAHHAEIGGLTPGSMPPAATCLGDEGVSIPPMLVASAGRVLRDDMRAVLLGHRWPTRSVQDNISDIVAAISAGNRAGELIKELIDQEGREAVTGTMRWINEHTADLVRERIQSISGLPASAVETMDDGTEIRVTLTPTQDGRLTVDFTGSSSVHAGNINAPLAVTRSAVAYVVRLLIDHPIPLNDGFLDPIDVIVPEGTFLNPFFPEDANEAPPVAGGNVETSQRITEALLQTLKLCAGGPGTMNNILIGNERFGVYETICSGAPASPGHQGADAVHQHMTNTRITDAEVLEQRYPLRVRRFEIREGSGGAGSWRGGCGVVREIEALEPVTVTVLTQRRAAGASGIDGGGPGAPGRQYVIDEGGSTRDLSWADEDQLSPRERLVIETPGGGGCG